MPSNKQNALADLRRAMKWILLLAILTVAGALVFLGAMGGGRTLARCGLGVRLYGR